MTTSSSGLRAIAARRFGMRCAYCGVPTAAEIEHVRPRSQGGKSEMDNLVLSCPLCNKKKGGRDVEEFKRSGDWRLPAPELPGEMKEMLQRFFGWQQREGYVFTGSPNARLLLDKGRAEIMIRAGRQYEWHFVSLGEADSARSIAAAWDFLAKHNTPPKPRKRWIQH